MHESRTRQPAAKTPLLSTHRSVSPSGELSNGDGSPVRFFISTTEHGVTRAFRNADRARVTSQLFCPERDLHSCYLFIYLLSFPRSPSLYQVKINNTTATHTVPLYIFVCLFFTAMTPTYNSKTAIQYHTMYNNCPLFLLLAKHPLPLLPQVRPLRQIANKGHGYIYSTLATYFYAGIYLHADINGHRPRRHNLVPLSYIIWSKFRIHLTLKYYTILCSQHNHCCVMYKNTIDRPSA